MLMFSRETQVLSLPTNMLADGAGDGNGWVRMGRLVFMGCSSLDDERQESQRGSGRSDFEHIGLWSYLAAKAIYECGSTVKVKEVRGGAAGPGPPKPRPNPPKPRPVAGAGVMSLPVSRS